MTTKNLPTPPKQIKVLHHIYDIVETTPEDDDQLDTNYGYTDYKSTLIAIDINLSISQKQTTLLHEILHATIEAGANSIKPKKKSNAGKWEHYFIYSLENTLIDVIRQNPELISYLTYTGE